MNRDGLFRLGSREARVRFLDADFEVIEKGDFVRCAVTGQPIPLDELRYWSVERQEAYSTPEAALKRHQEILKSGG